MSDSNNDSKSKWRCNHCNYAEWKFRSVEEAICHEKNCSRMKCSGIALDRISRSQCSDFFYKHRAIQALVSREKEECFFKLRQHDLLCRKGARIMPSTYSPRLFLAMIQIGLLEKMIQPDVFSESLDICPSIQLCILKKFTQ